MWKQNVKLICCKHVNVLAHMCNCSQVYTVKNIVQIWTEVWCLMAATER